MKRFLLVSALLMLACGFFISCETAAIDDSTTTSVVDTSDDDQGTGSTDSSVVNTGTVTKMTTSEQKAFFKTFVTIGDSLTQGCQGLNVEENRQRNSWPAQLARAIGTVFNQPLIEFPGVGAPNPEDAFRNGWCDTWSSTISHLLKTFMYWYRVDRYDDQAELNNFAISGATLDDVISYDGTKKITEILDSPIMQMVGLMSPFICSVVGLNPANAKSALDQALDRNPTFISVWIGNNDTIFGTIMGDDGMLLMTDIDKWKKNWDILVARIKEKKSIKGVLLINLPDNTDIAFLQPVDNAYCTVSEGADIPAGSKVPFFSTRASRTADVITPAQIKTIQERILAINKIINATAEREGWALLDAYTLLKNEINGVWLVRADGTKSKVKLTGAYATGGFFSLDGIHPSTTGYAVIANRAAKAINEKYGTSISVIDEVEVWENDSLCQDPIDPRDFPAQMGNMTYIFNTFVRIMAQLM